MFSWQNVTHFDLDIDQQQKEILLHQMMLYKRLPAVVVSDEIKLKKQRLMVPFSMTFKEFSDKIRHLSDLDDSEIMLILVGKDVVICESGKLNMHHIYLKYKNPNDGFLYMQVVRG